MGLPEEVASSAGYRVGDGVEELLPPAEIEFPWARLGIFEDLSFKPTPGPGYSEGGDVFLPERDALGH
jgi:hypothetical protein